MTALSGSAALRILSGEEQEVHRIRGSSKNFPQYRHWM